jgi:hypothetical protein
MKFITGNIIWRKNLFVDGPRMRAAILNLRSEAWTEAPEWVSIFENAISRCNHAANLYIGIKNNSWHGEPCELVELPLLHLP